MNQVCPWPHKTQGHSRAFFPRKRQEKRLVTDVNQMAKITSGKSSDMMKTLSICIIFPWNCSCALQLEWGFTYSEMHSLSKVALRSACFSQHSYFLPCFLQNVLYVNCSNTSVLRVYQIQGDKLLPSKLILSYELLSKSMLHELRLP